MQFSHKIVDNNENKQKGNPPTWEIKTGCKCLVFWSVTYQNYLYLVLVKPADLNQLKSGLIRPLILL